MANQIMWFANKLADAVVHTEPAPAIDGAGRRKQALSRSMATINRKYSEVLWKGMLTAGVAVRDGNVGAGVIGAVV